LLAAVVATTAAAIASGSYPAQSARLSSSACVGGAARGIATAAWAEYGGGGMGG
jgi:hypothetical protein